MYAPLERWFLALSKRERVHVYALAILMVGCIAHFLAYAVFYIEDAGISIAYARNFVAGEGWVTYAGGERVEGFSNPLWTWLVALWMLVGISGWTSVKVMGAVLGAACLPLSYLLARASLKDQQSHIPLIPPVLLAASSTFAVWTASGLENALFCFLMAAGAWRVLIEARENRADAFPWSSLLFLGLAVTRPEGIVYAAVAGLFRLVFAIRDKNVVGPIVRWVVVFFLPFVAYHAWRYHYFAWEFPNTYYAKMDGENRFRPWQWNVRGWKYVVNFFRAYGFAYILPVFAVALVGLKDRRRWLVVLATVIGATLLLWNGREGVPNDFDPDWLNYLQRHWDRSRVIFLLSSVSIFAMVTSSRGVLRRLGLGCIGLGAILLGMFALPEVAMFPVIGLGGGLILLACVAHTADDALARMLLFGLGACGVFFIVYSGGDWMKQWRFFSYILVPLFVVLGLGLGRFIEALPGPKKVWAPLLIALTIVPNLWQSVHAAPSPETSVSNVYQRVRYMTWVQKRLHLERITLFDVDMGAHMFYTDWKILDVAGLVDVSMARHNFQKAFIREYVLEEGHPDFAHQHGGWANKTKIKSHPEWKREYLEIPGYPTGKTALHVGNHVRKDIFVRESYDGPPDRRVRLQGGVIFEGYDLPAPVAPVGGELFVEYWLHAGYRDEPFRVYVVLDDGQGHRSVSALPAGYDWYPPEDWKASEHVRHRYDFGLHEDLVAGTYDLGFLVIDNDTGEVLAPVPPVSTGDDAALEDDAVLEEDIVYADGVVWFEDVVTLVSRDEAEEEATVDHDRALELLAGGDCEGGLSAWREARYHLWKNEGWRNQRAEAVDTATASCYVGRALAAEDRDETVQWLVEARLYDHHLDELLDATRPLAAELDAEGDALAEEDDWEGAYVAWRDALRLDPRLSWTRKKAEQARDIRLGVDGKVKDSAKRSSKKGD
ncbi:MAG TPA: hypothetical protein QGF58_18040 [Myxococcota bacterium]|nr:hypothetical protein [Myxococcota bacterium]